MKKQLTTLVFILTVSLALGQNYQTFKQVFLPSGVLDCSNSDPYVLVFHDEFAGTELDNQKWYTFFPGGPSLNDPDNCHFCRTHDEDPNDNSGENQVFLDENVSVSNGELILDGNSSSASWQGSTYGNSAGVIHSAHHWSVGQEEGPRFQYGFFEMRAKLPEDNLWWPAFWLFGSVDGCGTEIDILESFPGNSTSYQTNMHGSEGLIDGNLGCNGELAVSFPDVHNNLSNLRTTYHTFGAEWTPMGIKFYYDGTLMNIIPRYTTMLGQPIYCGDEIGGGFYTENLALSKRFTSIIAGLGTQHNMEPSSDQMKIDYIRVWQKNPDSKFSNCNLRKISGPDAICLGGQANYIMGGNNSQLDWTVDNHLEIISQSGNKVTVKPSSSMYKGPATISVKAWSEFCAFKDTNLIVWIGKPLIPSTIPSGNPAITLGIGSVQPIVLTQAQGASINSANWTATGSISISGSSTGASAIYQGNSSGTGIFQVRTSNSCGFSPYKSGQISVIQGGGGPFQFVPTQSALYTVWPNPVSTTINIDLGHQVNSVSSIALIDPVSSSILVQKNNVQGKILRLSVQGIQNGSYLLRFQKKDGSFTTQQILIRNL